MITGIIHAVYADNMSFQEVMIEWAKSKEYTVTQQNVKRLTLTKCPCGLAGYRPLLAHDLVSVRYKLAEDETINLGKAICPLTNTRLRAQEVGTGCAGIQHRTDEVNKRYHQ